MTREMWEMPSALHSNRTALKEQRTLLEAVVEFQLYNLVAKRTRFGEELAE